MSTLDRRIREVAQRLLDEGRCTIEDVADEVMSDNADLIEAEARALIYKQIKATVKTLLGRLSDDDETEDAPMLPGLKLPSVIAVRRKDGGYDYVRTDQAVWSDLQAGLREREDNIVRATAKRDRYRDGMDRLRPWMQDDESVTVAEALRRERDTPTG